MSESETGDWRVVISTTENVYQTDAIYSRNKARILAGRVKRGDYGDALKVDGRICAVWAEQNEHGETVGPVPASEITEDD